MTYEWDCTPVYWARAIFFVSSGVLDRIHLKTFQSNGMKKSDFLSPLSAFKVV